MTPEEFDPTPGDEFVIVTSRKVAGTYSGHYFSIGDVVTYEGVDHDGDAMFVGPDPTSSAPLRQTLAFSDIQEKP